MTQTEIINKISYQLWLDMEEIGLGENALPDDMIPQAETIYNYWSQARKGELEEGWVDGELYDDYERFKDLCNKEE